MTKVRIIESKEMKLRLTTHNFHKTLTDSGLSMDSIETMCLTMYRMGISPLTTVRKYLGKYDLGHIKVVFVDASKHRLNEFPAKMDYENPAILVFLKESQISGPEIVKLKYYSAMPSLKGNKYPLINFISAVR